MGAVLSSALVCSALPGCSSAYDAAVKDLAMSGDTRLKVRTQELLECADHALRSLNEAMSLYARSNRAPDDQVNLDAWLNAAEADAFELHRRGLSVQDAAREMGQQDDENVIRVLQSVEELRTRASGAIAALRSPAGNADASTRAESLLEDTRLCATMLHQNALMLAGEGL